MEMNRNVLFWRAIAPAVFCGAMAVTQAASAQSAPDGSNSYFPLAVTGTACATSISIWRDGDAWITGCGSSGDNTIYELVKAGGTQSGNVGQFQARNFSAKQVAVDPDQSQGPLITAWAVTAAGGLYHSFLGQNGVSSWSKYSTAPSCVRSIAAGFSGFVFIVKCDGTAARLSSSGAFTNITGAPANLKQVAVPVRGGMPWFITNSGDIYQYPSTNTFVKKPGCATSIGMVGSVPWVTGCGSNANGNVFSWSGSSFVQVIWGREALNLKAVSGSYEYVPWGIADGTSYPLGSVIERTTELDFKGAWVPQMESNWCWAASAQTAYNYVRSAGTTSSQQCQLVNGKLGRSDCCNSNQPCNLSGQAYEMLSYLGVSYTNTLTASISWEALLADLASNSPIVASGKPSDGNSGHAEVVDGAYSYDGIEYVDRWNPEPVGVGTLETVDYPNFLHPYPGWTIYRVVDGLH